MSFFILQCVLIPTTLFFFTKTKKIPKIRSVIPKNIPEDCKTLSSLIICFSIVTAFTDEYIIETKNPAFSMLSSVKCRNSQEINDFSTLSDTPFYPLFQIRKCLQCCFHSNPEGYRKSTVRPDNC